jgi:hypothetical protein
VRFDLCAQQSEDEVAVQLAALIERCSLHTLAISGLTEGMLRGGKLAQSVRVNEREGEREEKEKENEIKRERERERGERRKRGEQEEQEQGRKERRKRLNETPKETHNTLTFFPSDILSETHSLLGLQSELESENRRAAAHRRVGQEPLWQSDLSQSEQYLTG